MLPDTPGAPAAPAATETDDFWTDNPPPEEQSGTPPAAPQTWTFTADGDEINVDGSQVNPDGSLTVPAKHREIIEQLLAEGAAHRGSWRGEQEQYETRIAELEQQLVSKEPEIVRAKAFSDALLALLDQGPEKVAEWLDNHQTTFPKFKAEAETTVLRQQLAERDQRLAAADEERLSQDLAPTLQSTVAQAVTELAQSYPGVNAEKLYQRITTRFLDQVAYEVPALQRRGGLQRGEVLIGRGPKDQLYIVNTGLIRDEFAYQADLLKGSASAAAAAALGGVPPNLAPGEVPQFKSKKGMEDWIESGEWRNVVFKER